MSASVVPAPPEAFNFARYLLEANARRADKAAFIDDAGVLTYGLLDERARRLAAALRDAGVKREERVLILMQDGDDWPVTFLGAMLAGVVPVAVNTLLTADDCAYLLEHSRAQAVVRQRRPEAGPEGGADQVRPRGPQGRRLATRPAARIRRGGVRGLPRPATRRSRGPPRPTPTIPPSGSIRRARPAGRRARSIRTRTRTGRPSSTARRCSACGKTTSASRRQSCSSPTGSATR